MREVAVAVRHRRTITAGSDASSPRSISGPVSAWLTTIRLVGLEMRIVRISRASCAGRVWDWTW